MRRPAVRVREALDVGLAAVLVVLGQVELVMSPASDWLAHAIGLTGTAPLAMRRRWPLPVLGVVVLALCLLTARGDDTFSVAQLLGMMLGTYTVGCWSTTRWAGAGLAGMLAAAFVNNAVTETATPGDYVFATILLGVPWAAGVAVRRWRARADELAELAARLAASRDAHASLVIAAERGRIARDLHDTLAQTLNAVVVHAEAAEAAITRDEALVRHSLVRIRQAARDSLAETRALLGALRGADEDDAPRLAELDRLVQRCRADGVDIDVQVKGGTDGLSPVVDTAAYRIVQEALTNVQRHAPGARVCVTVEHGEVLTIEIRNSGAPRTATTGREPDARGYGLIGMQERAALLGGGLTANREGDGFVVRARLPVGGSG